jgi:type IV pilus assembly protein PilA
MSDDLRTRDTTDNVLLAVGLAVGIGLLAALVWTNRPRIPVTPVDALVRNNLRQIAQGAEQSFMDQGVSSIASAALVGTNSSQYVKSFATVANESYTAKIWQNHPITASGISGARTVTYAP